MEPASTGGDAHGKLKRRAGNEPAHRELGHKPSPRHIATDLVVLWAQIPERSADLDLAGAAPVQATAKPLTAAARSAATNAA